MYCNYTISIWCVVDFDVVYIQSGMPHESTILYH